jgi:hypothetical protein
MPNVFTVLELGCELLNSATLSVTGRACNEGRGENKEDYQGELPFHGVAYYVSIHATSTDLPQSDYAGSSAGIVMESWLNRENSRILFPPVASTATVATLGLITIFTVGARVDGSTILRLEFPASVGLCSSNPEIVLLLMRILPRLPSIS